MKKFSILALALVLTTALLTGCGCSANVSGNVEPSTTKATTAPPTKATTAPTTAATTAPTTEATRPSTHATMPSTQDTVPATDGLVPDMTDGDMDFMDGTNDTSATGESGAARRRGIR